METLNLIKLFILWWIVFLKRERNLLSSVSNFEKLMRKRARRFKNKKQMIDLNQRRLKFDFYELLN
jgi:hypothetical protein